MAPPWHLLLLVASVGAAVQCPDGTKCNEKTLCCELPDGNGYGCCPQDEVISRSLPMMTSGISCTEWTGCPEEYSCVSTPQGGSACCPISQGTSCQDGHHCCPSGSKCTEDGHYCIPASNLSAVICPDGASECPNDASCCPLPDQSWACCPMPQAICCNDHLHCCPHNTVCDLEHGKCTSKNGDVPLSKKFPAQMKLVASEQIIRRMQCQDGSSCPDGSTCCMQHDQSYGCCPFLAAVCCDDHIHCCPSGTSCDVAHKKCVGLDFVTPLFSKMQALREQAGNVQCDETSACPDGSTCCRMASGEWGCCPLEKAVCCSDKIHCCPEGYTCNGGSCVAKERSIPWYNKVPALRQNAGIVQCDQTSACPDGSSCCRLASGEWGCCPLVKAVCCPDKEHCCPQGYTCNGGSCVGKERSIPWYSKVPALRQNAGNVQCDETSACPDGSTCCRLASGEWGCCPLAKAVCCPDKEHCCPEGYTCNGGSCVGKESSIPYSKVPALRKEGRVQCDDAYACPDGSTCCRLASGEWGCCPLVKAVCCPDKEHCCPEGYTCNGGSCVGKERSIPWYSKVPALRQNARAVQCDETSSCPDGSTCCRMASGEWGCCPLVKAVCCSDKIHCCPEGYTCNGGSCVGKDRSIPWYSKVPALRQEGDVQCDDTFACPDKTTCCVLQSGEWGCCPIEQAVCCSDHLHCCPSGYTCDVSSGTCNKPLEDTLQPATTIQPLGVVWCDSAHYCYDGQTCCVGFGGAWTCCPYAMAVCCPDRMHCCPYGHVCLNYGAQCSRSGNLRWDLRPGENNLL